MSKSIFMLALVVGTGLMGCAADSTQDASGASADAVKVKTSHIADREFQSDASGADCELGWFSKITFNAHGGFGGELAECTDFAAHPGGGLGTVVTSTAHLVSGSYKLGSYDKEQDETALTLTYGGHSYLYRVGYGGGGPHDSTFTMFLEAKDGVQRTGMDAEDDLNTMSDE